VYDGIPGDPDDDHGTQLTLKEKDGLFYAVEGGIVRGDPETADYYKVGAGGWIHTAEFEDVAGQTRDSNSGVYVVAERALTEKLGAFAQLGSASESRNQIGGYAGGGLRWRGLLLEDDVCGIAVAHARNGDRYMQVAAPADRAETAVEVTWQVPVAEWLTVQPSLQYVMNPGMDPAVDHALVFGLRVTGTFN
jgi:porin